MQKTILCYDKAMQKTIRIFLLVLIIIGIILLFTQKVWVPKLVNSILASETSPAQITKTTPSNPPAAGQNLSQVYSNSALNFSLDYPAGYAVDDAYQYQELGPGENINGVKFTIPASVSSGTNLGSDSYISVGRNSK